MGRNQSYAGMTLAALFALSLVLGPEVSGQHSEGSPEDTKTVDGLIAALYESISGPIGQERDFERFSSLFVPTGRLQPINAAAPNGYASWTPQEYWDANAGALVRIGFTEAEIGRTTETFGSLTHVFSTYESYRSDQGDPDTPFARGINSIQLVHFQDRFWILSITWDSERPGNEIPAKYIGG